MTDEKRTIHIQTVTLMFACEDEAVENLDNLNERIKRFVQQDVILENELTQNFDGVTLVADSKHADLVGTIEDFEALAAQLEDDDDDEVLSDDGLRMPLPKQGKEYLN